MAGPYTQVVLFGDSLLQGASQVQDGFSFQGALQHLCMRRLDVINRGFSGYTTKNALYVLPDVFPQVSASGPRMEYLIILLGANDACLPIPQNTQHIPLDQYKSNLTAIVNHERIRAHNPKILLVTPPPVDEVRMEEMDLQKGHPQVSRHASVSATYSDAARRIASEVPGVTLIDLHKGLMDKAMSLTPGFKADGPPLGYPETGRGGLAELLPDGLHMSGEAYRVFFDLVEPHIGPFPDGCEGYPFPGWQTLNG